MQIDGLGLPKGTAQVGSSNDGTQRVDRTDTSEPQSGSQAQRGENKGDVVQISDEARLAAKTQETDPASDVRPDKVEEARKFLEAGLYNDQGNLEQTAQNLVPFFQVQA